MEHGAIIKHDISKAPKTGDWRYMHPVVDKDKCAGCGTCVKFCPEAVIEIHPVKSAGGGPALQEFNGVKKFSKWPKAKADIDYHFCKGCGVCAEVCPMKAIKMEKN